MVFWSYQNTKVVFWKLQMGHDIQEWTKSNLWKTTFKKFEVVCLGKLYQFKFLKAVFHKF